MTRITWNQHCPCLLTLEFVKINWIGLIYKNATLLLWFLSVCLILSFSTQTDCAAPIHHCRTAPPRAMCLKKIFYFQPSSTPYCVMLRPSLPMEIKMNRNVHKVPFNQSVCLTRCHGQMSPISCCRAIETDHTTYFLDELISGAMKVRAV